LVSLAFVKAFPERTAGLAFVEAHFVVEGWHDKMTAKLEFAGMKMNEAPMREWLETKSQRNHERRFRKADYLMWETSLVDDLRGATAVTEGELRSITQPVLALYGEHSDVIERGRELKRLVPQCELHVLPGGTHSLLMENTPWVRDHILGWLERVAA
jgi:pimeloyl-ACP methyl ester carboxylesterase